MERYHNSVSPADEKMWGAVMGGDGPDRLIAPMAQRRHNS
jgi:hypothetical protein